MFINNNKCSSSFKYKNIPIFCKAFQYSLDYRKTIESSLLGDMHVQLVAFQCPSMPSNDIQVNSHMPDLVGPGKLVRHMQNLSYAYDGFSPAYASVYAIALGTSFDRYKSQSSEIICLAGLLLNKSCICLLR